MKIAVITGDIVNSTEITIENRKIFYDSLINYFKEIEDRYDVTIEMFRGDSFQCIVNKIYNALQISLEIKTFIGSLMSETQAVNLKTKDKSYKAIGQFRYNARISIGIGDIDFAHNSALTSDGTAFRISGRQLDEMKSKKQFLTIATDDEYNKELQMESLLLDVIMRTNTIQQNEVLNKKLLYYTDQEIANMLNIKQPAVNQRLSLANWHAIDTMLKHFKSLYSNG